MLTFFFVNNNLLRYIIMVHLTYSTINECLLESSGPFTYSYYTIEVVSATVISINNPEKRKDVTAVINSLILKSTHHDSNSKLVVDSGKLNTYTCCDIDFGSRKKLEMELKYGTLEHSHVHIHCGDYIYSHVHATPCYPSNTYPTYSSYIDPCNLYEKE